MEENAPATPPPAPQTIVISQKSRAAFWLSLAAFLVSLASLVVSMQQTDLAAEQKEASVWPFLEMHTATTSKDFKFSVVNKGIGPAIVKRIEVRQKGKVYPDFYVMMQQNYAGATFDFGYSSLTGMVLSPQESQVLVAVNDSVVAPKVYQEFSDGFSYKIAFASVYGKLWLLTKDTTREIGRMSDFEKY